VIRLPDFELTWGSGDEFDDGGCVMQWVGLVVGHNDGARTWTDEIPCTNTVIAHAAVRLNDELLDDKERQRLWPLVSRLAGCRRTSADNAINLRLAVWAAARVHYLIDAEDGQVCTSAVEDAQRAVEAANRGRAWSTDSAGVHAAASWAIEYAHFAVALAEKDFDRVDFFVELLDAWDKACVEEGVVHELVDALCFVGSQVSGS
jgi:hypothetical protein